MRLNGRLISSRNIVTKLETCRKKCRCTQSIIDKGHANYSQVFARRLHDAHWDRKDDFIQKPVKNHFLMGRMAD